MTHSLVTSSALWALVLLPGRFLGGVLDHHCCHEVHEGVSCEHEDQCDGEECVDVYLPDTQAPSARIPDPSPDILPAFFLPELCADETLQADRRAFTPRAMAGCPFPQGSFPLLI